MTIPSVAFTTPGTATPTPSTSALATFAFRMAVSAASAICPAVAATPSSANDGRLSPRATIFSVARSSTAARTLVPPRSTPTT